MPEPTTIGPPRGLLIAGTALALAAALAALLLAPDGAQAALARAAGSNGIGGGGQGFIDLVHFFDTVTTYLVYLAIPAGALALGRAGLLYMAGNPMANQYFGGAAIGLVLVLLAKGIAL